MGAIRDFLFPQVQTAKPTKVSDVAAALTPVQISDSVYNFSAVQLIPLAN